MPRRLLVSDGSRPHDDRSPSQCPPDNYKDGVNPMAGFWTRLFQILRGRKSTQRARSVAQRYLRMELLEGRKLMANDLASITGKVVV